MKKRFLSLTLFSLILIALIGCGNAVKHELSRGFMTIRPTTVAVMPVIWDAGKTPGSVEIGNLFRSIAIERLISRSYRVARMDVVDAKLDEFTDSDPNEIAKSLGVDAILFIHVEKWKTRTFANYAALKMQALYNLYARDGSTLWRAVYATGESDIKFDKESLQLSIIEIYEPRIERLTGSVFDTLPRHEGVTKEEPLYDWLP